MKTIAETNRHNETIWKNSTRRCADRYRVSVSATSSSNGPYNSGCVAMCVTRATAAWKCWHRERVRCLNVSSRFCGRGHRRHMCKAWRPNGENQPSISVESTFAGERYPGRAQHTSFNEEEKRIIR